MTTTNNIGAQGISWTVFGAECLQAVNDLRWMIIFAIVLIGTDFWWGCREQEIRRNKAATRGEKERYKFHFSQAGRRTLNKAVDYLTYLLVGCVAGLAITEPMGMASHTVTAAIGLGFGCMFELSSIVGHICFVKGWNIKINWKRLLVSILTFKWKGLADVFEDAIEEMDDDSHQHHHDVGKRQYGHRGDCTISATYEDDTHHCGEDINVEIKGNDEEISPNDSENGED